MIHDRRSSLATYASGLLSEGRAVFSADEAERALGISRGAFLPVDKISVAAPVLPASISRLILGIF